jgi:aminomethyltransferase
MKQTPLNQIHRQMGGRLVDFAGWEMPVQYASAVQEHLSVRRAAGLFDVSHMGQIEIQGPDALDLVQKVTCNDASALRVGQVQYSALMHPRGTFVDDVTVYRRAADHFLLCVNASNEDKDFQWIGEHNSSRARAENNSSRYALLALQGPAAVGVLQSLTPVALEAIASYHFAEGTVLDAPCILSRTGYTGEDGFELYCPPQSAERIWTGILESGRDLGVRPAGLAARNTLRLEAKMALYGNDIDEETTVLEAALGWIVKWEKGNFIGRDALEAQRGRVPRKLVGFELAEPGIARDHYPIFLGDEPAGQVRSGSYAPFLGKSIGLVYLPAEQSRAGTEFSVDVRGRRLQARVVPTPFYKRRANGETRKAEG